MKALSTYIVTAALVIGIICAPGCGKKRRGGPRGKGGRYTKGGTHEKVVNFHGANVPNEILTYDGSKLIKKTHYHKNGVLWSVQCYDGENTYHGPWNEWFDNQRKASEKNYVNNQKDGMFIEWYNNGQKKLRWDFL